MEGFYKYEDEMLMVAPNFVQGPTIDLKITDKDTYSYPVEGWSYFATEEEAKTFFGIVDEVEE